ncbi:MAG TPA: hypothetical protein VFW50_14790, partial [Streptosporangiaceae bacterium]|nr:hypothetical protein [Streptosporangiaceae bacterium]
MLAPGSAVMISHAAADIGNGDMASMASRLNELMAQQTIPRTRDQVPPARRGGRKNAPPRAVRTGVDDSALTFGPRAVPLSVLDLAPVPDGGTAAEALRAT